MVGPLDADHRQHRTDDGTNVALRCALSYRYDAEWITDMIVNGQPVLSALTYRFFGPASGWTWRNGIYGSGVDWNSRSK